MFRAFQGLSHGICNEMKEEFEKRKEMCHHEGNEQSKEFLKRRFYE